MLADAIIDVDELTEIGAVRRFFNIAREDGIASWFAVMPTWMLSMTAVLPLYMAMDDAAQFREHRHGGEGHDSG